MLKSFQPYALAVLRIVTAFLYLLHGVQKTLNVLGGLPSDLPANALVMLKTAGWIETIGGVLILIGLFTSPVAFILCGEMAVAFFIGMWCEPVSSCQFKMEALRLF